MVKKIMLLGTVFFLFSVVVNISSAEIIRLKNGSSIRGAIVQSDESSITVQQGRSYRKYYRSQIEEIETSGLIKELDLEYIDINNIEGVTPHKASLIVSLLKVNGVGRILEAQIAATIEKVPIDKRQDVQQILDLNEAVENIIPVYSSYFSEDDINDMVTFFSSSVGKKMIEVSPQITSDILESLTEYVRSKIKEYYNPED